MRVCMLLISLKVRADPPNGKLPDWPLNCLLLTNILVINEMQAKGVKTPALKQSTKR